ncbi:hypothetical protein BayCH28_07625 [Mycolicibacterium sp. CH28]|uniref:hypothetical protein n=1 Tax=Mycolicibacterium sp. CH28 TaxID=2512237 RepID=UPI00108208F7|nr:hypothetical protein [Mycolicibacterium sp. CH28]TGD89219.1 hypothetical protein BayCH28_07625 [Mycolicibacterium sp. CH28]
MGVALGFLRISAALLVLTACPTAQAQPDAAAPPLADASEQSISAVIDAITTFPTELDPRIWDETQMKPAVREMSLKIVDRLVRSSGIDGLTVDAVELMGSNASYEYDDTSDYGMHVFVHSPSFPPAQLSGLLKLLNDEVERRQEGQITFRGVPVEVTFHSERTENYLPRAGIGQYSISEGRWIEMPVRQPDNFDRAQMAVDLTKFIGAYNDLVTQYWAGKKGFDCSRFDDLDEEFGDYRDSGFTKGLGSRSTQNLTYRALRRLNVSIPDLLDTLEDQCTFVNESIG